MKLRIKFTKHGPVKFIGHLDIMRYFQKANRRAQLDVKYTGGYSPHQVMSFAAPLGVGLESNGEYMDIEVNSLTSCEDVRDRLNKAGVPGIRIVSVKVLPESAGNAMASVAAASYTIRFREGCEPPFDVDCAIKKLLSQEQIPVIKETKKGVREVDLRKGIYEMRTCENSIYLMVDASSCGNIKPQQVIRALYEQNGCSLDDFGLLITREETYTVDATSEKTEWIPLDCVGTDTPENIE